MRGRPITIVDGARLELEGREVLVVLTPFECDTMDKVETVTKQLMGLAHGCPVAFAKQEPDGSYSVIGIGESAALRTKLAPGVQWTKIPVHADESAGR
jgi:hypothetical protein